MIKYIGNGNDVDIIFYGIIKMIHAKPVRVPVQLL